MGLDRRRGHHRGDVNVNASCVVPIPSVTTYPANVPTSAARIDRPRFDAASTHAPKYFTIISVMTNPRASSRVGADGVSVAYTRNNPKTNANGPHASFSASTPSVQFTTTLTAINAASTPRNRRVPLARSARVPTLESRLVPTKNSPVDAQNPNARASVAHARCALPLSVDVSIAHASTLVHLALDILAIVDAITVTAVTTAVAGAPRNRPPSSDIVSLDASPSTVHRRPSSRPFETDDDANDGRMNSFIRDGEGVGFRV